MTRNISFGPWRNSPSWALVTETKGEFARAKEMYFGGDLESSIPLTGQVAGRIDAVKPVAQVIAETVAEFEETVAEMSRR